MARARQLLALVLIALTLVGTGGSWHAGSDDHDAGGVVVAHDHRAHHERLVTGRQHEASGEHCAICHWLQAFGARDVSATQVVAGDTRAETRFTACANDARTVARVCLPARAPPV